MQTGDVYYWTTTQAKAHLERRKYHLFICEPVLRFETTFLFINKSNSYGTDFEIEKAVDCPFLPLPYSYVSCSAPVFYSEDDLGNFSTSPVGRLSKECLGRLCDFITASEVMADNHKWLVCNALRQKID